MSQVTISMALTMLLLATSVATSQTVVAPKKAKIGSETPQRVDIRTSSGVTYTKCKITKTEPDGITILHSKGVAKIPFTNLSQDYKRQFNYNPSNATDYAEAMAKQHAEEWKQNERNRAEATEIEELRRKKAQADLDRWQAQDETEIRRTARPRRVGLAGPVSLGSIPKARRVEQSLIGFEPSSSSSTSVSPKREEAVPRRYATENKPKPFDLTNPVVRMLATPVYKRSFEECCRVLGDAELKAVSGNISFSSHKANGTIVHIVYFDRRAEYVEFDKEDDINQEAQFSEEEFRAFLAGNSNSRDWLITKSGTRFQTDLETTMAVNNGSYIHIFSQRGGLEYARNALILDLTLSNGGGQAVNQRPPVRQSVPPNTSSDGGNSTTEQPIAGQANVERAQQNKSRRDAGGDVQTSSEQNKYENARFPVSLNGLWGYINSKGRLVIDPAYDDAMEFSEGLAEVEFKDKWGYVDVSGTLVIPLEYDSVSEFSQGLAAVKKGTCWGYVDRQGEQVIPFQFQSAAKFSEERAAARKSMSMLVGYIDRNGSWAIQPQFKDGLAFSGGLAVVWTMDEGDDTWGFIKKNGAFAISPRYTYAFSLSEGLAAVAKGMVRQPSGGLVPGNCSFINERGDPVINPSSDDIASFYEGLARVRVNGMQGFIDKKGQWRIRPQFENAMNFSEGLAPVSVSGKWGFVDINGKLTIPYQYDFALPFTQGVSCVIVGEKMGYIDKTGKYIWEPTLVLNSIHAGKFQLLK